jgi:hypothetical protein
VDWLILRIGDFWGHVNSHVKPCNDMRKLSSHPQLVVGFPELSAHEPLRPEVWAAQFASLSRNLLHSHLIAAALPRLPHI